MWNQDGNSVKEQMIKLYSRRLYFCSYMERLQLLNNTGFHCAANFQYLHFSCDNPIPRLVCQKILLLSVFIGKVQKPFNRKGNKKMFKSSMNLRMAILVSSYLTAFYKSAGKNKFTSLFGWCLIHLDFVWSENSLFVLK